MTRRIIIEAVSKEEMRPPYNEQDAGGDWFHDETWIRSKGHAVVRVIGSNVFFDETFLFALHELVEMKLCFDAGITAAEVDAFDAAYTGEGEPGDHPDSPYREQHRKAMLIEHLMANFLGLTDYGEVK